MELTFTNQRMKLANVNVRAEQHGEEKEAAMDLKLEVICSNDKLSELHPSLKSAFYHYDDQRSDMADQGSKEPGFLPHLKFPKMADQAFKWDDEVKGAHLAIVVPGEKKATELSDVKVNNLTFTPKEGGSVEICFRVQYKPDEKVMGKLAMLVQQDVDVTLTASDEPGE